MSYDGSITAGNKEDQSSMGSVSTPSVGSRKLFTPKNPGSPGKLGKSSTKAESLAKLRGKGALA